MKHTATAAMWGAPVAIALVTLVGLVAALLGDGWLDALSWLGLGIPVIVAVWFGLRRR
ncbi:hypothetical protein BH09PSE6_BH09PSE6_34290 [soil metagenome]